MGSRYLLLGDKRAYLLVSTRRIYLSRYAFGWLKGQVGHLAELGIYTRYLHLSIYSNQYLLSNRPTLALAVQRRQNHWVLTPRHGTEAAHSTQ